jgi:uncharacterized protein involved in exopolysaccharide biosynthesis
LAEEQAQLTPSPPERADVLLALWELHTRLATLREQLTKNKIQVTPKLKEEIYMIQTDCLVLKTCAFILKDNELDELAEEIEEIKKELDKKGVR